MVRSVADAARARRNELDLTAAELSNRTTAGKPLSRAVISDLETGRKRTLEVTELVTLAASLELSPLSLLFPNVVDNVEILPDISIPGTDALGWFLGIGDAGPGEPRNPFRFGDSAMHLAIRLVEVERTLRVQEHNLYQYERGPEIFNMSDRMREAEKAKAAHAQKQIELLSAEREDLLFKYQRVIEDRRDG